jgi:hypothetical protein
MTLPAKQQPLQSCAPNILKMSYLISVSLVTNPSALNVRFTAFIDNIKYRPVAKRLQPSNND